MKINGLLNVFRYSPVYAVSGFVILLGVSVISGMLPIFTLQRKTPAEIVAKYDL
jgi:ABC-type antimicrobial peptide transport system permease subunit